MAQLTINGVAVKPPKSFQVGIQDIDGETGRNANGDMVRDRITTKRKLDCEWGMMTQEEMSQLLNAVSAVFFEVSYPDPLKVRQLGLSTSVIGQLQAIPLLRSSNLGLALNLIW